MRTVIAFAMLATLAGCTTTEQETDMEIPEEAEKLYAEAAERIGAANVAVMAETERMKAVGDQLARVALELPERTKAETLAILSRPGTPEERKIKLRAMFRSALREMQEDETEPPEYREAATIFAASLEEQWAAAAE